MSIYVGTELAAKTFDLVQYTDDEIASTSLSAPVDSVTVGADGYVTIAIDTGDVWYLLEDVETVFVRPATTTSVPPFAENVAFSARMRFE